MALSAAAGMSLAPCTVNLTLMWCIKRSCRAAAGGTLRYISTGLPRTVLYSDLYEYVGFVRFNFVNIKYVLVLVAPSQIPGAGLNI